jgi:hypothetical protein
MRMQAHMVENELGLRVLHATPFALERNRAMNTWHFPDAERVLQAETLNRLPQSESLVGVPFGIERDESKGGIACRSRHGLRLKLDGLHRPR